MSEDQNDCDACKPGETHAGHHMQRPATVQVPALGGGVRVPEKMAHRVAQTPAAPRGAPTHALNPPEATGGATAQVIARLNTGLSKVEIQLLTLKRILMDKKLVTNDEYEETAAQVSKEVRGQEANAVNLAFLFLTNRLVSVEISIEALLRVTKKRGLVTESEILSSLAQVTNEVNDQFNQMMGTQRPPRFNPGNTGTSDPRQSS